MASPNPYAPPPADAFQDVEDANAKKRLRTNMINRRTVALLIESAIYTVTIDPILLGLLSKAWPGIRGTYAASIIQDAIDIGQYDTMDIAIQLYALDAGTVQIDIATATQKQYDDFTWGTPTSTTGHNAAGITLAPAAINLVGNIIVPASTKSLFRYIRWRATLAGGATKASFAMQAMLRKRGP